MGDEHLAEIEAEALLKEQRWLTEDARECARVLFERLPDTEQKRIIDDELWEWSWLLWSPLTQLPAFPPSFQRRLLRDHRRRSYPKRY